ncbi:MAG: ABC transporter ATP-binding protein [Prevotellaceae bacterium]|jgi:iron complex transport system ATP-binding protein|nr:ABC transporter ATP-binding protein [Prevotellaceae bacterium]
MDNGELKVDNGELKMENCLSSKKTSSNHSQFSILNSQFPSSHSQFSILNSQFFSQFLKIGYNSGKDSKFPEISLDVNNPGLIVLLGRNGVGKSTLLRTLAGLQSPVSGELKLMGKDISQYSQREKSSLISFVSTEKPNIANMTAFNLVSLGRYSYTNWLGSLNENDEQIVRNAMKIAGVTHLANDNINEISDGELQRVMIARTLAQDTPVIILDEPVAFLDLPNKFEILLLLRNLAWNEKKTIILSAHDFDIAIRLADMLWIMTSETLEQGAPEDFALNHGFKAIFKDSGIFFDYKTGIVDAGINLTKEISLVCDDANTGFWLTKAFNRLGFRVSNAAAISVEVKNGNYICKKDNVEKECCSVYELCKTLQEL